MDTSILVVDDESGVRDLMSRWLVSGGYDVRTAANADEALQRVHDAPPAVALCDIRMPGQDGLSVCRALRQDRDPRLAEVPVVLITGRADAQDTEAGFSAGVTDYLTKPFKPTHLVARLQSWLIRSTSG